MNKESLQSCDTHKKKVLGGLVSRWMRSWPASLFLIDILISAQRQSERKWKDHQRKHRKALKVESISQC